jgi:hypothetical protein
MNKYREAFEDAFDENIYHRIDNEPTVLVDGIVQVESIELIEQLVSEKEELQSRKDKLVVGSEWECVAHCYGENRQYKPTSKAIIYKIESGYWNYVEIFIDTLLDNMPTDQFLLCFKPKGGKQ